MTGAIGIQSRSGRYEGGTYAHKDLAFEFGSWLSPEFKLYLIREFQRLKEAEQSHLSLEWDLQRMLAKVNYRIHTDAIKERQNERLIQLNQAAITQMKSLLGIKKLLPTANPPLFGKGAS